MCGMGKIRCYPYRFALSVTSLEDVILKNEIWDSYSVLCFQSVRLDVKDQIIEQNDKWLAHAACCGLFLLNTLIFLIKDMFHFGSSWDGPWPVAGGCFMPPHHCQAWGE